jgi:hypothetical protein
VGVPWNSKTGHAEASPYCAKPSARPSPSRSTSPASLASILDPTRVHQASVATERLGDDLGECAPQQPTLIGVGRWMGGGATTRTPGQRAANGSRLRVFGTIRQVSESAWTSIRCIGSARQPTTDRQKPFSERRCSAGHCYAAGPVSARSLADLVAAFRSCTLPHEEWTHDAHLRVGAWHVHEHGADDALTMLRSGIRRLNDHHGTPNSPTSGYHETITIAYVRLIAAFLSSFDEKVPLERRVEVLVAGPLAERSVLLGFWSRELLMSARARAEWVPPDLAPLAVPTR